MRQREMKRFKVVLGGMTPSQREELRAELRAELAALESRPAAATVIEGRVGDMPACPHCATGRVIKHGTANGLQRYRCRGCGKTFCALTVTPLAGLHQRGKWLDHVAALRDGLTPREVAQRLHIAVSTAHRWRHRFLAAPKFIQSQALGGIAEADETYFLRSHKGQRKGLDRPPRKRGGRASKRGLSAEQVPVLVVRDRAGGTADFILPLADKNISRPFSRHCLLKTPFFAPMAAARWRLQPAISASNITPSTSRPAFASSDLGISRTSMPITLA